MKNFRKLFLLLFLLATSCASHKLLTSRDFDTISVGENASFLEQQFGTPYNINKKGGIEEYIYIERISLGGTKTLFKEYTFLVSQGKIVDKRVREIETSSLKVHY